MDAYIESRTSAAAVGQLHLDQLGHDLRGLRSSRLAVFVSVDRLSIAATGRTFIAGTKLHMLR